MDKTINVYCDESCHLLHDESNAMVLGALWTFKSRVAEHHQAIAALKKKHNLSPFFEIKWTKVSAGKLPFYIELLDYFFNEPAMGFRAWVVPDKSILKHEEHGQTHDDWYYKMYFYLLRNLIWPGHHYEIYMDIKDTRSRKKLIDLKKYLHKVKYDFPREVIQLQHVHSHDIGLLQLSDLLIGAISYKFRGESGSAAKQQIIGHIKKRSGLQLDMSTLPGEKKFNLCIWKPNGGFENA
jgi:hypothetical protein